MPATNAYLDLGNLLGEEVTLRLLLADGSKRAWHGHVTHALQLGADGGFARYRLVMEPWLAFLGQRRDNYLFQDKTVLDILGQIFADYPQAHWTSQVTQKLRTYSIATQHRETDLAFITRLLAEEGLSFRFEHDQSASAGDDAAHARHQLVIFDRDTELPVTDANAKMTLVKWKAKRYCRFVLFFSVPQAESHATALIQYLAGIQVSHSEHASHSVTREWSDADIDRLMTRRAKKGS